MQYIGWFAIFVGTLTTIVVMRVERADQWSMTAQLILILICIGSYLTGIGCLVAYYFGEEIASAAMLAKRVGKAIGDILGPAFGI